jgi:hypothetical protein
MYSTYIWLTYFQTKWHNNPPTSGIISPKNLNSNPYSFWSCPPLDLQQYLYAHTSITVYLSPFYEESKINKCAIIYKHIHGELPSYLEEHIIINKTLSKY